jgi:hypothetical protein
MQINESEYVLFFCKILEVYTVGIVLTEVDLMSLSHARSVIEESRNDYNLQRRQTSLKGVTPYEFAGFAENHGVEYSNYGLQINWGQPCPASIFVDLITSISQQILLISSALHFSQKSTLQHSLLNSALLFWESTSLNN